LLSCAKEEGYLRGEVFSRDKADTLRQKADSFCRTRGKSGAKPVQFSRYEMPSCYLNFGTSDKCPVLNQNVAEKGTL
jgi:hypothetical protein